MKIIEFNRQTGIYNFELEQVETGFHAHPATEILYSKKGGISIETTNAKYENVCFAIIKTSNVHKVVSEKGSIKVLMVECNSSYLLELLNQFEIQLIDGIYTENTTTGSRGLIDRLSYLYGQSSVPMANDARVQKCLQYLNSSTSDYKTMIGVLKSMTNISESRLSHIFKDEIGMSIKKYLVWSRLKKAFQLVLSNDINMYEASLQSGFYDQAHLSKAFKQMLGLSPSEVYNSRTLQD